MSLDKKLIAFVLPRLTGGGAERSMVNLANTLARMGHPVAMVLFERTGVYLDQLDPAIDVVDLGSGRALKTVKPLKAFFDARRPAAVLGAMEHVNGAVYLAWRGRPDMKFIPTIRNHISEEARKAGLKKKLEFWLARRAYQNASSVVAVSQGVADDAEKTLRLRPGAVKVIYNPVITDDLAGLASERPEHEWLAVPKAERSEPVVLGVGRLAPQKDFGNLIEAVRLAREKRPMKLVILGEGDERAALERQIASLQASEWVSLPGFAKNPFAAMAAADLFVLSSKFEGLPGVLIQAMASGCPVVSTDCPSGPTEILQGGKYGGIVPVGDPKSLAAAILASLESPKPVPSEALDPFRPLQASQAFLREMDIA